jgi:hypothetical protein
MRLPLHVEKRIASISTALKIAKKNTMVVQKKGKKKERSRKDHAIILCDESNS